jgi:hypothetical protein
VLMRDRFLKVATPPYLCYFCGGEITDVWSNGRESLNIHHIDGDHSNNAVWNWASTHKHCHSRYHMKHKRKSEEWKANMSQKMMGNTRGKYGRTGKPK